MYYARYSCRESIPQALLTAWQAQELYEGFRLVEFVEKDPGGPFYVSAKWVGTGNVATWRKWRLGGRSITESDYWAETKDAYERRLASPDAELVPGDARVLVTVHGQRYHPVPADEHRAFCGQPDFQAESMPAVVAWRRGVELCGHCATIIREKKPEPEGEPT